jgi:hypothetical protein
MGADPWRSLVHAVVVDRGRMLLVPSGEAWALPAVELDGDAEEDLRLPVGALERHLGSQVTVLRYADRAVHRDRRVLELVYVLERPDPVPAPPGARWVSRGELSQIELTQPAHRELLDRRLREDGKPVPALRPAWARDGWLEEAGDWIEASLAALGRPLSGRIEQIRSWCLSSLLRVPTANGAVFFKATAASPLFADEGRVMGGLAELFPGNVPAPLAIDTPRRWMLLDDHGPELGWDAPLEVREDVLRVFARMQIESAERVEELLGLGCVDRRLDVLAAEGRALLDDEAALADLDDDEAERARAFGSRLDGLCAALAESRLPDTLLHGDLHLSNVAQIDGRYLFYDWTDASVGHPLFDLIDVFREESEQIHAQLRDVYLSSWVGTEPIDRLRDIWTQAQPLAFLHHAVSYRHISANVEPGTGQELEWALPSFLRKMLEAEKRAA